MINDVELRKNLLVSLITSILVLIFIEPFLKWAANAIMWLGANISVSFTKSVYTSAALGFREKYSFMALIFILSTLSGIVAGITASRVLPRKSEPTDSHAKRRKLFPIFSAILFFVSGVFIVAQNFIELQLNASFNQRITVLSAKVNDQKIKELKAAWALMENRSDYESITEQMNNIAQKEKIKLPSALWE